jgi:hypothetical protein
VDPVSRVRLVGNKLVDKRARHVTHVAAFDTLEEVGRCRHLQMFPLHILEGFFSTLFPRSHLSRIKIVEEAICAC